MPDPTTIAANEAPPAASDKPKRVRRPRAPKPPKPPAAEKPKRTRRAAGSVQTLERKVAAMGENFPEALRILSKRDPDFKAALRDELGRDEVVAAARVRVDRAAADLMAAKDALETLTRVPASTAHLDRLKRLAGFIMLEGGPVPPQDADDAAGDVDAAD